MQGMGGAVVTINGTGGTLDGSGFDVPGWDIQSSEPGEPEPDPDPGIPEPWMDSTPFFTGTSSLWVDGTEYPFVQGYEDETGHRSDRYENASAGTVTLIGNTADPGCAIRVGGRFLTAMSKRGRWSTSCFIESCPSARFCLEAGRAP